MKKFIHRFVSQNFKAKSREGQVRSGGRFDKLFAITRRNWGLAARLEHIRNRGRQNEK